jgi:hypothetical protein
MHLHHSRLFFALLLVFSVVASSACRKRNATPPVTQGEVISPSGPATPVAPGSTAARIPTQEDIYQATRKFMDRNKRSANSLEELVGAGLLAPLPEPPAGKMYVLDQRAALLRLTDK